MGYTDSRAFRVWPTPPSNGYGPGVSPVMLPEVSAPLTRAPRSNQLLDTMRRNVRNSSEYGKVLVDSDVFAVAETGHALGNRSIKRLFGLAKTELVQRNKTERTRLKLAEAEAGIQRGKTQVAQDALEAEKRGQQTTKFLIFGGVALVIVVLLLRR